MSDEKIRELEQWEKETLAPLLARKEMARMRLAETVKMSQAIQHELKSIEVGLSATMAIVIGGNDDDVYVDLGSMIIMRRAEQDPPSDVTDLAAAIQKNIDAEEASANES